MAVEEEQGPGIPEWVVTFGDMMSLLLTFFIMLVSMSEIKQDDIYQAVAEALRERFGADAAILEVTPGKGQPRKSVMADLATLGRARRAHTMDGGDKVKAPVGENPRVSAIRQAEYATMGGGITFAEGSAKLSEENRRRLDAVAEVLNGKPQKIEIRGHTTARPLSPESQHSDHWNLAYSRCRAVMKYLVEHGIDSRRIRLTTAADNEPRHISENPILLKDNARVEIYLLNELVEDLQGTPEEKQKRYSGEDLR